MGLGQAPPYFMIRTSESEPLLSHRGRVCLTCDLRLSGVREAFPLMFLSS